MKIFANNFCLHLMEQPTHGHFSFEGLPLAQVASILLDQGTFFDGQVFYVPVGQADVETAIALLEDRAIAEIRTEVILLFAMKSEAQTFFDQIKADFKPVSAAGGLINHVRGHLMVILRNGLWDLPKGKVEEGESMEEAAVREVMEETGVSKPEVLGHAATTYHVYFHKDKWRMKTTEWYWMRTDMKRGFTPATEEGITEVSWWDLTRFITQFPKTFPQIQGLMRMHMERAGGTML